ncbi:hypothetical protein GGQ00_003064 [Salinibacter ruber]|uniref:glycosyltransferase family 2 protein n=1 Tax=Salinibacter ruber TaxID=146919 RepID=UPI002167A882|nr:glycosyltransferase family A protein [Salinibacter ruber]MCS4044604.1 hypothetical protein [Salinibacter ruber]
MTLEQDVRDLWPETMHDEWMDPAFEEGLVSVIVPTYNRADLLPQTLESVRKQTYRPIELVVVDDGSTDETLAVLHRWKEAHEGNGLSVRILTQENSGAPAARNRGLVESRGEYIQYLDSDDLLHPQKVEIHVDTMCTSEAVDYVASPFEHFEGSHSISDMPVYDVASHVGTARLLVGEPMSVFTSVWKALFRRRLCHNIGPWCEGLQLWQDVEYNIRLSALCPGRAEVDILLYFMREHSGVHRIKALKQTSDGTRALVNSLDVLERSLSSVPSECISENGLRARYLQALHVSLRAEHDDHVHVLLDKLSVSSSTWKQHAKILAIRTLYRLFGGRLSSRLIEGYSTARLGETSA